MKTLCISLIVIALLILAVQIVTEIIKAIFKDKDNIVYNLIVFGVSLFKLCRSILFGISLSAQL